MAGSGALLPPPLPLGLGPLPPVGGGGVGPVPAASGARARAVGPGWCGGLGVGSELIAPAAFAAGTVSTWGFFERQLAEIGERAAENSADGRALLENGRADAEAEGAAAAAGALWAPPLPGTPIRRQLEG